MYEILLIEAKNDYKMMERVLSCWEMWDLGRPRGLHKGIIRFHINNNNIIMVGNSSIYAKTHLPKGVIPIKVSKVKRLPSIYAKSQMASYRSKFRKLNVCQHEYTYEWI
eukprot:Pgem_evm1s8761